jgi:hypothetical protein
MAGVEGAKLRQPFHASLVDDGIIKDIYEFHFVTVRQFVRLHYRSSSVNYARERLSRLVAARYLSTFPAPRHSLAGKSQLVYQLTRRALRYLGAIGYDTSHRLRLLEAPRGDIFTLHALGISELMIGARLLASHRRDIRLTSMRHERDLKRTAARYVATGAAGAKHERTYVVPDAWLEFHLQAASGKAVQQPIWVEWDRGSAGIRKLREKCRGIVRYVEQGHYERVFGTKRLRVGVAIDGSAYADPERADKRVKDVVRWIEEELSALGKGGMGKVFAVCHVERPDQLDAKQFFLAPTWSVPYHDSPISLLNLPEYGSTSWGSGMSKPALAHRATASR